MPDRDLWRVDSQGVWVVCPHAREQVGFLTHPDAVAAHPETDVEAAEPFEQRSGEEDVQAGQALAMGENALRIAEPPVLDVLREPVRGRGVPER
ncbi:MAG TPA: hypothetical protein VFU30_10315 [Gaiellaceae bacterium]|nr:hypothetical protein [Gaiellaceae bacterium]